MVQFTKLRLSGFKSFVEPTELTIERGITGIVGPNGCGKSNLVEALKWVMGETSAKQVRGSEMSDVIFGGTGNRPARNIAEVILSLDNTERTSPAQFNDNDELEVSRRIEREKGSAYKVNAKDVRARDVQLLFADAATGARSTALVSQGHIGEVINAKPTDRRSLLEEAAGITGLHSRRHEAELRLRGAETNLERLDDVMITLDAQMQGLKKQARQANRYRSLNDHIRRAEATLFLLRWIAATEGHEAAAARLSEIEAAVAELTAAAARASTVQAETASALPALREAEVTAAAALHRLTVARESLDEEERRITAAIENCDARIAQIDGDTEREKALATDATEAAGRLEEERGRLGVAIENEAGAREQAEANLAEARTANDTAESRLAELTTRIADAEARRAAMRRRHEELTERVTRLEASARDAADQLAEARANAVAEDALAVAGTKVEEAKRATDAAHEAADAAGRERSARADALSAARDKHQEAQSAAARLEAEAEALAKLLESENADLWPPVIDAVTVEPGYELALGAALGDDLSAATDEAAPVHWHDGPNNGDAPDLPAGAEPLGRFVRGPAALNRRLGQIGVVADSATGRRLAEQLRQGQRLVTREGDFWRWDGFSAAAEAPTAAGVRLGQRNRLTEVRGQIGGVRDAVAEALRRVEAARAEFAAAELRETQAREAARAADAALSEARDARAALDRQAAENRTRISALQETAARIDGDLSQSRTAITEIETGRAELPDAEAQQHEAGEARADVAERRARLLECQSAHDNLKREMEARRARLEAIAAELQSWSNRRDGAETQLRQLTERRTAVEAEREKHAERPTEIAAQRGELMTKIEAAETERNAAADRLAEAETKALEADRAAKDAQGQLSAGRENRVRAEATVEQTKQALDALAERIADRLNAKPDRLREIAELDEGKELPELEATERRVERLLRERENMGPVNLRAEQESQELAEQIETMETERGDLIQAIEKLRHGISELNREGRQRLLASFEEVDKHFQELFVRLFGGGRAHLTLTDSDDPLEAGLEIMASPPGKRLQVLSLLSGGEQALTALALLFAVFLTNPAPICVLDEVDAPLDDANVDRFCSLVEEIAHTLSTRFLVITHHRMTMARMDRLYGVTMAEQGVSQLVSVDLGEAEQLRATA